MKVSPLTHRLSAYLRLFLFSNCRLLEGDSPLVSLFFLCFFLLNGLSSFSLELRLGPWTDFFGLSLCHFFSRRTESPLSQKYRLFSQRDSCQVSWCHFSDCSAKSFPFPTCFSYQRLRSLAKQGQRRASAPKRRSFFFPMNLPLDEGSLSYEGTLNGIILLLRAMKGGLPPLLPFGGRLKLLRRAFLLSTLPLRIPDPPYAPSSLQKPLFSWAHQIAPSHSPEK